ncbi:MAG: ParB/RepB/Spo0J family partition protein [Geminicoccaceae bacterium]
MTVDKAARKRGLGMGLSALLGGPEALSGEVEQRSAVQSLPIELLRPSPFQPRRRFDAAELEALADSVREKGVLQPLLVRPVEGGPGSEGGPGGYEIVAGERRWRAAQLAGLHELPVVVRPLSDQETLEVALIENLQRADLSAIEEAQGFRRLVEEFGHSQEDLASAIGKSRSHVANTLRLLALPEAVQTMIQDAALSAGHARALLGCPEPERLAQLVVEAGLSVRETEDLVRRETARPRQSRARGREPDPNLKDLEDQLTSRLGLEVGIRTVRQGGFVTIRYHDLDQLDGLLRRLG